MVHYWLCDWEDALIERRQDYADMRERIVSIETKLDGLIIANMNVLKIVTGNGDPEKGIVFKVATLEEKKKKIDRGITALCSVLGLVIAGILTDWCHRIFWPHK